MILDGTSPEAIAQAVDVLAAGGVIGLPTETVYGLAADAENAQAVSEVFRLKGRPLDHPLIVHVQGEAQADRFAASVPGFARALMSAFWPGPLTLIVPRRAGMAEAAAGGQPGVGLRCPSHPVARALLAACAARGVLGLAAPSANRFGRVSATTAAHVAAEFGEGLPVLDGGPCEVGIESAIVDCTRGAAVLLRPGAIGRAALERASGERLRSSDELAAPDPKASGTLSAHYAPRARLRLMDARALRTALEVLGTDAGHVAVWARTPLPSAAGVLLAPRMPDDAAACAHALFATLRAFDDAGARLIWVETPPADAAWEGVRDRLQRAAAAG